ncbi:MAG: LrgB family protein [Lachnospiraceae bacterium]|nr:LrgB family protein [Lachnospiraceae bacterium]
MSDIFSVFTFFGVAITLLGYEIGVIIKGKFKWAIFNPLLLAILFVIAFLVIFHVDYETYNEGAQYISYLMTPATVCLAIPLYQQMELLKKNAAAVLLGILSGVLASLSGTLLLAWMFGLTHKEYVTMLPKSITTAIGIAISEEMGGIVTITIAAIIITGLLGNIFAETACKIFRIEDPIAKGVAIGTASHAMGTAKAMEMGEVEGAMSSLAIAVAGLITVVGASVFAQFI